MHDVGRRRGSRLGFERFQNDERLRRTPGLVVRVGESELQLLVVARKRERLLELVDGLVETSAVHERPREVTAQGNVVGRDLEGLPERLQVTFSVRHGHISSPAAILLPEPAEPQPVPPLAPDSRSR